MSEARLGFLSLACGMNCVGSPALACLGFNCEMHSWLVARARVLTPDLTIGFDMFSLIETVWQEGAKVSSLDYLNSVW